MESECSVCLRISKYKCVKYNIAICNVQQLHLVIQRYCKEEKKIGYCKNFTPTEDEVVIVEPLKKVKKNFVFNDEESCKVVGTQLSSLSLKIQPTKKTQSTIDLQSAGKTKESTITSMEIRIS